MSFAEEMLNLGEKLITSCEGRISFNKNMIKNTGNMLNKFHRDNRQMGRELRNNLGEFTENLSDNVHKMRKCFKNEHKEMAKNQQENLSEFTNNMSRNVGGFIRKCHKKQVELHNMFAQAHKNFFNCMKEIERKKKHPHKFTENPPLKRGRKKKSVH